METLTEIRAWRAAQRARLTAARMSFRGAERIRSDRAIEAALTKILPGGASVGFYWPIRGEFDARSFASALRERGTQLALPVVIEKAAPVVFRSWRPDAPMTSGIWDIPIPAEGETIQPQVLLVPLVGFDERCYRLGNGGGYYDRTLAALPQATLAIGIGYEFCRLDTIYPQSHDVPMSTIVTEARVIRCAPST